MTRDECREYLPENWLPILEADPMLWEIFSEHEYGLEQEAVPPFLIQELRGGNLEHLRPLLSLYGKPGLELLEGLLGIQVHESGPGEGRQDRKTLSPGNLSGL